MHYVLEFSIILDDSLTFDNLKNCCPSSQFSFESLWSPGWETLKLTCSGGEGDIKVSGGGKTLAPALAREQGWSTKCRWTPLHHQHHWDKGVYVTSLAMSISLSLDVIATWDAAWKPDSNIEKDLLLLALGLWNNDQIMCCALSP